MTKPKTVSPPRLAVRLIQKLERYRTHHAAKLSEDRGLHRLSPYLIAIASVSTQFAKATMANPADALRYE
jgi:hypothetical protein